MSMISQQIDELEKAKYRVPYSDVLNNLLDEAIGTIKDLSEKVANDNMVRSSQYYHAGWVPVDERLPEEGTNPVSNDAYIYPVTAKFGNDLDIRYYAFCHGHWYHGAGIMDDHVVAWMPRPEVYKEEAG